MSKSLQSFEGKVQSLKMHIQLVDIALTKINRMCSRQNGNGMTIAETLGRAIVDYPQLNGPNETAEIKRVFSTSRIKVSEQAIIELYAYFADYLAGVIRELENTHPTRILGIVPPKSPTDLSYKDILTLGSYAAILDEIAKRVYRNLEDERSTNKMLKKFIKATNLNVAVNIQEDALVYLEIRHLIIHNNSKADDKFNRMNNRGLVTVNNRTKKIAINYALTIAAIDAIGTLCRTMDHELVRLVLI